MQQLRRQWYSSAQQNSLMIMIGIRVQEGTAAFIQLPDATTSPSTVFQYTAKFPVLRLCIGIRVREGTAAFIQLTDATTSCFH
jgi:hypothetical protein